MPLIGNFTTSQVYGEPSEIVFTDTSTGSDVSIVKRRIYIQKYNGSFVVENGTTTQYEEWNNFPATSSITLNLLDKDYGLKIVVEWLTSGNTVVTDKTIYTRFTLYNDSFDYGLTQLMMSNPRLIDDNNFWDRKSDLRTFIDSGNNAVDSASDIASAQLCYDEATELRINAQYWFNQNS